MTLLGLSWKNLTNKPLNMGLSLILFALGVGLISFLINLNHQLEDKFDKNLAGIDLVVGAKGSPLQLILSSMYHIDAPTGNISIASAAPFLRPGHPLIELAVPLSLGDSYRTYRIVGTGHDFPGLYAAELASGRLWETELEATIGAAVANEMNLNIGDEFFSSHGLIDDPGLAHDEVEPFVVVGIFEPSGTVLDQLVLTDTRSIWHVHGHAEGETDEVAASDPDEHDEDGHEHADGEEDHDHPAAEKPIYEEVEEDITSLLVRFKGRNYQALNMQRNINENTDMQGATPAIEINRLYSLMGVGASMLRTIALIIVLVSGLSIFISLFTSLKERRYELALMRVMGSSRGKIFSLIVLEGLLLAVIGYAAGIVLSHAGLSVLAGFMKESYRYTFSGGIFLPEEFYLFFGAIVVGLLAAAIPAWQAMRTNIHKTLSRQ